MTIFPRHQGGSVSHEFALRCKAHRILDRARAGADIDPSLIRWALAMTGDDDGSSEPEPQQEAA